MTAQQELFLVAPPGLEQVVAAEARAASFDVVGQTDGGVTLETDWTGLWRAHLTLRTPVRMLLRLAQFRALHLAQLDKRSRRLAWDEWLPHGASISVDATTRKSKIYHQRAAADRVKAAAQDAVGPAMDDEQIALKLRIEDDLATISLDVTGDALYRRGYKQQVNKAPLRENLASAFLMQCGFTGKEPVYDPMCGSGTIVIEAAEIAAGVFPGRARQFAFETLPSFDADAFDRLKRQLLSVPKALYFGSDRDQGAVKMSQANATKAGLAHLTRFHHAPISDISPPCETPGLVFVNPPYGGRVGNKKPLFGLYAAFGEVMCTRFPGWRVGLITSDPALAKATGLPFGPAGPPIDHGGIKIKLYQTQAL